MTDEEMVAWAARAREGDAPPPGVSVHTVISACARQFSSLLARIEALEDRLEDAES